MNLSDIANTFRAGLAQHLSNRGRSFVSEQISDGRIEYTFKRQGGAQTVRIDVLTDDRIRVEGYRELIPWTFEGDTKGGLGYSEAWPYELIADRLFVVMHAKARAR